MKLEKFCRWWLAAELGVVALFLGGAALEDVSILVRLGLLVMAAGQVCIAGALVTGWLRFSGWPEGG